MQELPAEWQLGHGLLESELSGWKDGCRRSKRNWSVFATTPLKCNRRNRQQEYKGIYTHNDPLLLLPAPFSHPQGCLDL